MKQRQRRSVIKRSCRATLWKQTLGSAHGCEEIRVQSEREFPQMISTVCFNELTGSPALIRVAEMKQAEQKPLRLEIRRLYVGERLQAAARL